jgi:hypothetical protein
MANMQTIGRLHRVSESGGAAESKSAAIAANSENTRNCAELPAVRELPMRGRLRRFQPVSPEPAGYQLDSAEIMSIMHPAAPLDRSFQFAAMAERERLQAVAQRYLAARGMHF